MSPYQRKMVQTNRRGTAIVNHPQITPNLREGRISLYVKADIFALGWLIAKMCKLYDIQRELQNIASCCLVDARQDSACIDTVSIWGGQVHDQAPLAWLGTSATKPITPNSTASITEEPPSPVLAFRPAEGDTAELGQQGSPNVRPSASTSRHITPVLMASAAIGMQGPPSHILMSRSGSHEVAPGTASSRSLGTPSKKCKRPTKLSRAEASGKSIVTDLLEGQDKAKRCR